MTPSSQERSNSQAAATPASSKKKKEQKQKIVTGYILYSSEVRKAIVANNPESTFGKIVSFFYICVCVMYYCCVATAV